MPPFGILRHRIVQRTKPLTSNRRATLRNPEAPNCTGTRPLARNRRATPLLRSPRLVGTVCCRTSSAPNKKMKYLDALVVIPLAFSNCHSGSSSFFFNTNSFIFSSSCSAQGRLFDTAAHHSHSVSQPLARPTTCRTLWRWRQRNTQQCWSSLVPCTVALQSRGTAR